MLQNACSIQPIVSLTWSRRKEPFRTKIRLLFRTRLYLYLSSTSCSNVCNTCAGGTFRSYEWKHITEAQIMPKTDMKRTLVFIVGDRESQLYCNLSVSDERPPQTIIESRISQCFVRRLNDCTDPSALVVLTSIFEAISIYRFTHELRSKALNVVDHRSLRCIFFEFFPCDNLTVETI